MTSQSIFNSIGNVCPKSSVATSDIITVILDTRNLGKQFTVSADGKIEKKTVVSISKAVACQFYVPDHATLEKVLNLVSESPSAAVTNCGWKPVGVGIPFIFTSKQALLKDSLDPEGVHKDSKGVLSFARLKEHASPSTWQVLDRDEDEHTPQWARDLNFDKWVAKMDTVLPGLANSRMLRAHSSSARVLDSKGKPVGGGNGHTWIKIVDARDADRCRTAIIARALALELTWLKPKLSKKTGGHIASAHTTIVDQSVWSMGRLLFVGKPTATEPLTVMLQGFTHIDGGSDSLDTSKAVIGALETYRASKKLGAAVRITNSSSGLLLVSDSLNMDTEIELEDGQVISVQETIKKIGMDGKLRCQAPFRASLSFAAFIALDNSGNPFVWDSGIDTKYVLASAKANTDHDFNSFIGKLKAQLNNVIGEENTEAIIDIDALQYAWGRSFMVSTNNKIGMLNAKDDCIELLEKDAESYGFREVFGPFFHQQMLSEVLNELTAGLNQKDKKVLLDDVRKLETKQFLRMLKTRKQVKQAILKVDMFANRGHITTCDGVANITLPHRALSVLDRPSELVIAKVVADYYEHFPEFGPFLEMLLHARFSPDRRRAFVWLHANSDFGKGFMTAIFKDLGLLFEISSTGIESVIAGKAVGLSPSAIYRCWILHVDEFKAASRELKQLNTSMQVSAKFQLETRVDLFIKLFSSAENVRSLSGGGIETQFNMRFSYVHPVDAALDSRPLFKSIGKGQYISAMKAHVADYLNAGVVRLVGLGKDESSRKADAKVDEYQLTRRLTIEFGDINVEVRSIAKRVRSLLRNYHRLIVCETSDHYITGADLAISTPLFNMMKEHSKFGFVNAEGIAEAAIQMPNAASFISAYINQPGADKSTAGKFAHKADEIARLAHCFSNAGGHVGNVTLFVTSTFKGGSNRGKGLVILIDGDDHDLDEIDLDYEPPWMEPALLLKEGIRSVDAFL